MSVGNERGIPVAIDIVPHNIDRFVPFTAIDPLIHAANVVISEARTLMLLLGTSTTETPPVLSRSDASSVGEAVIRRYGPGKMWVLRFGLDQAEEELLLFPAGDEEYSMTDYRENRRLFGDKRTAAALLKFLDRRLEN